MDNLISVIVPVYNVENYLNECVESIINQTYSNLEIILIDDGSTDNSGAICDSFNANDSRVVVVHKNNNGQGAARNDGINIAKGQYIAFVDSDDYIERDMIMKLYSTMKSANSDISVCGICAVSEGTKSYNLLKSDSEYITFTRDEAIPMLLDDIGFTCSVWNKLFKREVIGDYRLEEGKIYEDIVPMYNWFKNANTISYVPEPLYNYRFRKDSTTKSEFLEYNDDLLKSINCFRQKFMADYPEQIARIMPGYISYGIHYVSKNLAFKSQVNKQAKLFKRQCFKYWKVFNRSHRIRKVKKRAVLVFIVCPLSVYSIFYLVAKKITKKLLD